MNDKDFDFVLSTLLEVKATLPELRTERDNALKALAAAHDTIQQKQARIEALEQAFERLAPLMAQYAGKEDLLTSAAREDLATYRAARKEATA